MPVSTTDGRSFIYGLFDADGYECKTLVGVFSTEELAETAAEPHQFADQSWTA